MQHKAVNVALGRRRRRWLLLLRRRRRQLREHVGRLVLRRSLVLHRLVLTSVSRFPETSNHIVHLFDTLSFVLATWHVAFIGTPSHLHKWEGRLPSGQLRLQLFLLRVLS